ncbi:TPA: transposase, partial [Legionella pneumophila]|nr:transposase [Legionella pneumophila]
MTTNTMVVAGVDTHADTHHAAVVDTAGRQLGDASFPATARGYEALAAFVTSFGDLVRIGIEGTGSYGAGLSRRLRERGIEVVEVIRPNRQTRRMRGKSDPIDAYAAARTALTEQDAPVPKSGTGQVEHVRYLLAARRSAIKARTSAQVQIKTLLVTAPDALRSRFRNMSDQALIATLGRTHAGPHDPIGYALKILARRHQNLTGEIADLDAVLAPLIVSTNPALAATKGVGPVVAAQLLVTAGDNPDRLRNEAAFAAL